MNSKALMNSFRAPRPSRRFAVVIVVALALVASACSDSSNSNRSSSDQGAGDPTVLPALPGADATGEQVPLWTGAVVTPTSWVSTSLSPTLSVPGATGAWTFTLSDLSDGKSEFGTRTYAESGASSRIPLGAGLQQGNAYFWTATSPGQQPVGGSFTVDIQLSGVQETDSVGGVTTALGSGEASFAWSSHAMGSVPGSVGFGLQFQASNPEQVGVPKGWKLQAASSFPYVTVPERADGSVALAATDGTIANYRRGAGNAWVPVKIGTSDLDLTGLSPVLLQNPDGTFAVTTKAATAVFARAGDTGVAYLSSVEGKDTPMLGQSWSDGRLQSITDPVSQRSVTFVYGGGECPKPVRGFRAAPAGMLCAVKFWDGSTSAILYVDTAVGPSIGRLVDFPEAKGEGAQVVDLAFDSAGRIARTRSPLVAAAAASNLIGIDDEQFWTSVNYTPAGRVQSLVGSAAVAGATRCARSYDNSGSITVVSDSCLGGPAMSVTFDPTTFFTLQRTNNAGLEASYRWDLASGHLLSRTDEAGLTTTYRYENGNMVQATGPTKGSLNDAASQLRVYDQSFTASGDGVAMRGLDVTYWPGDSATTDGAVQELGPRIGGALSGSLTVNWPTSPAGNDGTWSGLMTGVLQVKAAGEYRIVSGNSTAKVRVNNVLCVDGACDRLELGVGANQVRIDLESATSTSSMDVSWSGPDTGGVLQSIPTDVLRPGYGYATTTETIDPDARDANVKFVSKSTYEEPANGRVTARTNQTGSRTNYAYDGVSIGTTTWVRPTTVTTAGGSSYTSTYWDGTKAETSPCPGAKAAVQGGAPRSTIAPGPDGGSGPTTTQWVDASGAVVAAQYPGGVLVCTTYGRAGQTLTMTVIGNGGTQKVVNDHAVDGNPLVAQSTETDGDVVTTTRVETDLLGRVVRSVDRYGIVTTFTYDTRTGNLASRSIVPTDADGKSLAPVVIANTWNAQGWLAAVSVDGRVVATPAYNSDATVSSVVYGDGVVARAGYDAQNRIVSMDWATPSGAFANRREVSAGGNTSSSTFATPSGSSTFTYVHDADNRLSAASVTAGLVPVARAWAWTFDASSNRLTQRITDNGLVAGDYTYAYNKASQLTSTTDPAAKDGLVYDDRGNATKIGSDSFTYDNANNLVSASDGTVTVDYTRDVSGSVIAKTTTGGPGAGTIRFSASGVLLDAASTPYAIGVSLPGGVSYLKSLSGGADRWQFTAIDGDAFFATDGAGALVGTPQVYDPYGNVLTAPNAPVPGVPSTTWKADSGNETEALRTPYQLMGARVYIPALGRFAQLDPQQGGSANGYDYVDQDPVNKADPSGNDSGSNWTFISVGAAFVVGLLTGATSSFKIGLVAGAIFGAVVTGVSHLVEYLVTGQTEFSVARLIGSVVAGFTGAGIGGVFRYAFAERSRLTAPPRRGGRPQPQNPVKRVGNGRARPTRTESTSLDRNFYSGPLGDRQPKPRMKLNMAAIDEASMESASIAGDLGEIGMAGSVSVRGSMQIIDDGLVGSLMMKAPVAQSPQASSVRLSQRLLQAANYD